MRRLLIANRGEIAITVARHPFWQAGWWMIGRCRRESIAMSRPPGIPAMQRLNEQADAGQAARGRIRIRSAEGGFRWLLRTMRSVHGESGTLVGHVTGFHDIQPEVEAEDRLIVRADRSMYAAKQAGRSRTVVSHETRLSEQDVPDESLGVVSGFMDS